MPWTKFVSMELDDEEKLDMTCPMPISHLPNYPYELRITFNEKMLKKLGIGLDQLPDIGDKIDLRAMACVTSVSCNETEAGQTCRVEMQIEEIALENEIEEETPKPSRPAFRKAMYDRKKED